MKLFCMEKELRIIKNGGHFPVLKITPQGIKIETIKDKKKVLKGVDAEIEKMLKAITKSEEIYERDQEEAKKRDEQLRMTRQTNRADFDFFTMVNSIPIRNGNTRTDQPAVHFDTNTICHYCCDISQNMSVKDVKLTFTSNRINQCNRLVIKSY